MAIGWLDNACMHVNNERYYSLREENGPETSVYPEDAMMSLRVAIVAYCKTQLHSCWRILQITFDFPRPDYWTMASFLNHKWQQLYQKSFANFQLLPQIPQIFIPKLSAKITSKFFQPKIFSAKFSTKKIILQNRVSFHINQMTNPLSI